MKNNDTFLNKLEKSAGIWSIAKGVGKTVAKPFKAAWEATPNQVKNIGKGGLAIWGASGAVDHYNEGKKISQVSKEASFDRYIQKNAFIGAAFKGIGKAINTAGKSKIVKTLTSGKAVAVAMGAEMLTGMYKTKRDTSFKINNEINNSKLQSTTQAPPTPKQTSAQPPFQGFKTASILTMPIKKYTRKTYYDTQKAINLATDELVKRMKKKEAFDDILEKEAFVGAITKGLSKTWKTLGAKKTSKFLDNALGTAFAADTVISLNNARKNIQYAAPKVQTPQRPSNTNMYNGGNHPTSFQNTYAM